MDTALFTDCNFMKVIINSDDLGYSNSENDAIFRAMSNSKITSASLIANGAGFEDAVSRIGNFPQCSFGVHLNVTEFRPLRQSKKYDELNLIDLNGFWKGDIRQTPRYLRSTLVDDVRQEWGLQIEKCLDNNIPISHLDSHHHVHTIPWLWPAVRDVQVKYNIKRIRNTKNLYPAKMRPSYTIVMLKKIWDYRMRNICGIVSTDYFTDFSSFFEDINVNQNRTVELMCHLGKKDNLAEELLLYSDWAMRIPFAIEMISYNQL